MLSGLDLHVARDEQAASVGDGEADVGVRSASESSGGEPGRADTGSTRVPWLTRRHSWRLAAGLAVLVTVTALVAQRATPDAAVLVDRAAVDTVSADEFFGLTRLHSIHLTISAEDFLKLPPPSGRGGRGFGRFRGPGDDAGYPKVPATLQINEQDWGTVTIRYKGNSSYRGSPSELKRSLKVEFDRPDDERRFFGLSTLNLNNNAFDPSQMREALAYDVFRRAGVPAPRTAFVRVYITVPGQYDHQYAGLFTAIEQIDQQFFKTRWGSRVGVLVKPEGIGGLPDFGDDWSAYEDRYGSKGTAEPDASRQMIAFIKFVNGASDEALVRDLDKYLDVDEFLHFLAAEVVIVNTDSPLAMNHNYWLTVHPRTERVVWLPWDMNMAFGGFMSGGSDLSLQQPAGPGMFPLAERMLAIPVFAERYRAIVKDLVNTHVSLDRLGEQMNTIAAAIREAVASDPTLALARFEQNFRDSPSDGSGGADPGSFRGFGFGRSGPPLRQFLRDRIASVQGQLEGTRPGTPGRGRGGFR